jgi:flagellar motility protein MotE (MotC chaperone)
MRGKILKVVFWSLFLIIGIKVVASLFLLLIHISNLQAKEKSKFEGCPPEFSKVLFIEREKLLKKEMELKAKEEELKLFEKRIREQIAVLKDLEASVEEKLNKIKIIQNKRFKLLVKAYSEMQPSKAAQRILNMDRDMAIKILSQLKSEKVASILSAMPPEKAASLSEALSGYPPKEY